MARAVHRSGLVALGIATALMASCAFAAKEVVVAVGSNFTTLDPYDANDTLSQAVAKWRRVTPFPMTALLTP